MLTWQNLPITSKRNDWFLIFFYLKTVAFQLCLMIVDSIQYIFFHASLNFSIFLLHALCWAELFCYMFIRRNYLNSLFKGYLITRLFIISSFRPTGRAPQMVPMKVAVKQAAVTEGFPGGSFFLGGCLWSPPVLSPGISPWFMDWNLGRNAL